MTSETGRTSAEYIVQRPAKLPGKVGSCKAEPGRTRFARLETEGRSETEIRPGASLRGSAASAKRLRNKKKKAPNGSLISGSLQDIGGGRGTGFEPSPFALVGKASLPPTRNTLYDGPPLAGFYHHPIARR